MTRRGMGTRLLIRLAIAGLWVACAVSNVLDRRRV